jgi:phosphopentomutase
VIERVALIVLDGFGVGRAPDAASYGDEGANSFLHAVRAAGGASLPNLGRLGLGMVEPVEGLAPQADPGTAHGRLTERSAGKDSATGHWELAGLVTERPFPTYPHGFPPEVIASFEAAINRKVLGNRAASGTEIITELGEEHLRTGRPIVYTSADSVFQVACHIEVAPPSRLYEWCRAARRLLSGDHSVARVIARPFTGSPGAFVRTPDRRDFTVPPPGPTLLDRCRAGGVRVEGVGKIGDVFDGRGLTGSRYSRSDDEGVDLVLEALTGTAPVLAVANLVDLDTTYGHRNDPAGYIRCLERFDRRIPELLDAVGGGILFVTGDHGCDPTSISTDHSREQVPLLAAGRIRGGPVDVGARSTFADVGATIARLFDIRWDLAGTSFAGQLG